MGYCQGGIVVGDGLGEQAELGGSLDGDVGCFGWCGCSIRGIRLNDEHERAVEENAIAGDSEGGDFDRAEGLDRVDE